MDSEQLGRYRIISSIGHGGFATVFRGLDTRLNREVALKVLDPQFARDPAWVGRFKREAQAVAKLKHGHIVTIHDIDDIEGSLFIVMDLIDGPSLADAIGKQGRFPYDRTVQLLTQVADALDYAHAGHVLHRDLKPANILLDSRRGPVLTDFGFARIFSEASVGGSNSNTVSATSNNTLVGTPQYIAPELWDDKDPSPASDQYALACVVYEMLTGQVLFAGRTPMAVMRRHDEGPKLPESWPPGVPAGVNDVLRRALAPAPKDRYPSAREFAAALAAAQKPAAAPVVEAPKPVTPPVVEAPGAVEAPAPPPPPQKTPPVEKPLPPVEKPLPPVEKPLPTIEKIPAAPEKTETETEARVEPLPPIDIKWERRTAASEPRVPREIWPWAAAALALTVLVVIIALLTNVQQNSAPQAAPGGALANAGEVLFTSNRDGKREIYAWRPGSGETRLTSTPGSGESWDPTPARGGAVLFTSSREGKREIYRLAPGGSVSRLTTSPGSAESWDPAWAADGAILFTSNRTGKRELYRLSGEGNLTGLTTSPGGSESWGAAAAADGAILFTSNRTGKAEIYRLSGQGEVSQLTTTPGSAESWAATGESGGGVLFVSSRDNQPEIYRLRGGQVEQLTHINDYGVANPLESQGGGIWFVTGLTGKAEVYWLSATGSVTRLTTTPGNATSWLPGAEY